MKKLLLLLVVGIVLINLASATIDLGTYKQGECFQIKQTCDSCTYVSLNKVFKEGEHYTEWSIDTNMTKSGTNYNYTWCNTTMAGNYQFSLEGDKDGAIKTETGKFIISPSGSTNPSSGQGFVLIGSLILILIVTTIFFIIAFKSNSTTIKIIFFSIAGIILVIAILYSVIMVQQILSGYTNIVSGIENFWFIGKILLGIAFVGLMIIIFLVFLKAWKIKRGYLDE